MILLILGEHLKKQFQCKGISDNIIFDRPAASLAATLINNSIEAWDRVLSN